LTEERVIQANNLGAFYKHVNQRLQHRDAIAALADDGGLIVTALNLSIYRTPWHQIAAI